MKKRSRENTLDENKILYECLFCCERDAFLQHYWRLVYKVIKEKLSMNQIPPIKEDIEDLRNEIFIDLLNKNHKKLWAYDESKGASIRGWIILIANRYVENRLRSKHYGSLSKRNDRISMDSIWGDMEEISPGVSKNNPKAALRKELELLTQKRLVERNIKKLKIRDREILTFYYDRGLSREDCAECFDMAIGNFDTAKSRAVKRLKKKIMEDPEYQKC